MYFKNKSKEQEIASHRFELEGTEVNYKFSVNLKKKKV